ncbi:hypothetical protein R6Q57_004830 [Mikania cordata]
MTNTLSITRDTLICTSFMPKHGTILCLEANILGINDRTRIQTQVVDDDKHPLLATTEQEAKNTTFSDDHRRQTSFLLRSGEEGIRV